VPLYEYECGECRHKFEIRQHFNEEPVSACPQCGGKCRRLIHATPFIMRGGSNFSASSGRSSVQTDGMGEFFKSGDDFFDRSERERSEGGPMGDRWPSVEETVETMKVDAVTRKMTEDSGVG
jgi:putative FmdB family regulatory protein